MGSQITDRKLININQIVSRQDILLVTLDTVSYDIAKTLLAEGQTPKLAAVLPPEAGEESHLAGNFSYATHQEFCAGFFPTVIKRGIHLRLLVLYFEGSRTITENTWGLNSGNSVT